MRGTAARGGMITALASWGRFLLQFGTVIVVARALGPAAYGFAAVVLVFTTLAEVIRTSGLASVVIQRARDDDAVTSALHLVAIAVGTVGGAVASLLLWWLTDAPGLSLVLLGAVPVLAGVATIPAAVLGRRHAFRRLALADVTAAVVGCATAIVAASGGAAENALVLQAIATAGVLAVTIAIVGRWRPGRPAAVSLLRADLAFAGHSGLTQVLRFIAQNADRVTVSAVAGPAATGLYAQATQLVALPVSQIAAPLQRVALPTLSRLRSDPERFRRALRSMAALVGLSVLPALAGLAAVADRLILLLFGPAWAGSAVYFRILAVAGAANVAIFLASWVLVSCGLVRLQSRVTLGTATGTVALIAVGAPFGTVGIALGVVTAACLTAAAVVVACHRSGSARAGDILSPLVPGAIAGVVVGAVALAVDSALPGTGLLALLCAVVAGLVAWTVTVASIRPARRSVAGLITALRTRDETATPKEAR